MKYRVREGFVVKTNEGRDDEKRFGAGETAELSADEYDRHKHKLEPVQAGKGGKGADE